MGTTLTAPVDPFEEAMRRKRMQEGLVQATGGAAASVPSPQPELAAAPSVGQPPVDHLSVAKLKQGIGAQLSPEEEAALAAESLQQQPAMPAAPAGPAAGEQGYMAKFMSMLGLGAGGAQPAPMPTPMPPQAMR